MPRELDAFSKGQMREDGVLKAAAPECKGQPGWVYNKGWVISEYIFSIWSHPQKNEPNHSPSTFLL